MSYLDIFHTDTGSKWLNMFDEQDKDVAIRLVESLNYIGEDKYLCEINVLLSLLPTNTALFASKKKSKNKSYEDSEISETSTQTINKPFVTTSMFSSDNSINELKFTSKDQNEQPIHGSESVMHNIINRFCTTKNKHQSNNNINFFDHPSMNLMLDNRVDNICFVDDFIGSGDRIIEMLDLFIKNKTIRSWFSKNKIKFQILTYGATDIGKRRVERHKTRPEVYFFERAVTIFESMKSKCSISEDSAKIFLKKYKNKAGYKGGMYNMLFQHGVPNNVPCIFYYNNDKKGIYGLFPKRSIPADIQKIFNCHDLNKDKILTEYKNSYRLLLYCLLSVKNREKMNVEISDDMLESTISYLFKCKLIKNRFTITELGITSLNKIETLLFKRKEEYNEFGQKDLFYCPRNLRKPISV